MTGWHQQCWSISAARDMPDGWREAAGPVLVSQVL